MDMKALKDNFGSADQLAHATINQVDEQLWVDKYSPNSFKELLSDERTNREVNKLPINFIFLAQNKLLFLHHRMLTLRVIFTRFFLFVGTTMVEAMGFLCIWITYYGHRG